MLLIVNFCGQVILHYDNLGTSPVCLSIREIRYIVQVNLLSFTAVLEACQLVSVQRVTDVGHKRRSTKQAVNFVQNVVKLIYTAQFTPNVIRLLNNTRLEINTYLHISPPFPFFAKIYLINQFLHSTKQDTLKYSAPSRYENNTQNNGRTLSLKHNILSLVEH